jgi:hypothetical protein
VATVNKIPSLLDFLRLRQFEMRMSILDATFRFATFAMTGKK